MNKRQAAKIVKHPRGHRRDQWLRAIRVVRILDWPAKLRPVRRENDPDDPLDRWVAGARCRMCHVESMAGVRMRRDASDEVLMPMLDKVDATAKRRLRDAGCPHAVSDLVFDSLDVSAKLENVRVCK